ncbi:unnamed protein product [Arctogadus glacialis]
MHHKQNRSDPANTEEKEIEGTIQHPHRLKLNIATHNARNVHTTKESPESQHPPISPPPLAQRLCSSHCPTSSLEAPPERLSWRGSGA